jgi:hypothetical protein
MSKDSDPSSAGAGVTPADPASLFGLLTNPRLPPVAQWNPAHCGIIDMRIARDGQWFYRGSPIGRPAMVRLFSTVLRREPDGSFCLVTPVEKLSLVVEDAPFMAVELAVTGEGHSQRLAFRTNVDEAVGVDADHPIRVTHDPATAEPRPYVMVRAGLEALIARPVFYELVERAVPDPAGHGLGVWSAGVFFPLGP